MICLCQGSSIFATCPALKSESRSVVSDCLWSHGLYSLWTKQRQTKRVEVTLNNRKHTHTLTSIEKKIHINNPQHELIKGDNMIILNKWRKKSFWWNRTLIYDKDCPSKLELEDNSLKLIKSLFNAFPASIFFLNNKRLEVFFPHSHAKQVCPLSLL